MLQFSQIRNRKKQEPSLTDSSQPPLSPAPRIETDANINLHNTSKMQIQHLPISALPAWSKLNAVDFLDIHVQDLGPSKGFGVVTSRALSSKATFDVPTLLVVPSELVLSKEAVEEWSKVDGHLKELLGVAGGKSTRGDVMLFLLMQITIAARQHALNLGASNPWTEYVRMLPVSIPLPTMWSEEERVMLVGTSLEVSESPSHVFGSP